MHSGGVGHGIYHLRDVDWDTKKSMRIRVDK